MRASILSVCLGFVAACTSGRAELRGSSDGGEGGATISEGDAHFTLALAGASESVGRLVGWNLGRGTYYAPAGDPYHPEWRTPERTATLAKLGEVRASGDSKPYVRFSGLQIDGALGADGYHFWDFVKPGRGKAEADNLSVEEIDSIATEIGGELTITLNFGSGTAAEAARYAAYLDGTDPTDPMVAARIANGHADPYGVTVFEIGNESYGAWNTGATATGAYSYANPAAKNGGDPAWSGRPSSSAADFAARALEYVRAVKSVVPGARFRVPLSQASMDAWGGLDVSIDLLRPLLVEPSVDAVVVHFYKAEDGETLGVSDFNAPEYAVAGSELFRSRFLDLRGRLDALPRSSPLGIAVTEYHVADGIVRDRYTRGDTVAVGLGIADQWISFAELGIDHACQHFSLAWDATQDVLVEPWYDPIRPTGDGGVRELPAYVVTRLLATHLLERRATLTRITGPTASAAFADAGVTFDAVHAVAFSSADGSTGSVALLQRDPARSLTLTFDLEAGVSVTSVEQWAPASLDENASDHVPVTVGTFRQIGRRAEIVAPPHSVVGIRFERRR
ncbi:MAG TPA: hypothetical protein VHE30_12385 [Polyangiaceae bacterium]|nr:hypothetical protein [Polyangiaceae bacterium]